jgi:hypothetical protein
MIQIILAHWATHLYVICVLLSIVAAFWPRKKAGRSRTSAGAATRMRYAPMRTMRQFAMQSAEPERELAGTEK